MEKFIRKTALVAMMGLSLVAMTWAEGEAVADNTVALDQLPAVVKEAAEKAIEKLVITSAVKETVEGVEIYAVAGEVDGVKHEIMVTSEGVVLKAEDSKEEAVEAPKG